MNENNKFRLVAFLLSLNSFLFVAAIVAVFTRFSRGDLNDYLSNYRGVIISNSVAQTEYISNLTARTSAMLLQLRDLRSSSSSSSSAAAASFPFSSSRETSHFRAGLNLVKNLVDTNDFTCVRYLSPSNYHFAVASGIKCFTYGGYPFACGDLFLDGGRILDFDSFCIKTDVAVYNLLDL